jgi:hypothetical protein
MISVRQMPHGNESVRNLQVALSAIRVFVCGHAETDVQWRTTSKFDLIRGWGTDLLTWFTVAFQSFHDRNFVDGGRILRHAFLCIEEYLQWRSSGHFLAICVTLPLLITGQAPNEIQKEVLIAYLRHTKALIPQAHPSARVVSFLLGIAQNDLEQLGHMVRLISKCWRDIFVSLRGTRDRSTLQAQLQTLPISERQLPISERPYFDTPTMYQITANYDDLLDEATLTHGTLHDTVIGLMYEGLDFKWQCKIEMEEFWCRCNRFMARLGERNSSPNPFEGGWVAHDTNLYASCCTRLGEYFHSRGDLEWAVYYYQLARSLKLCQGLCWVRDARVLEKLLRRTARFAEAETVRYEYEILQSGYMCQV